MLNLLHLTTSSKGFVPTSTTVLYNFILVSMKTYHKLSAKLSYILFVYSFKALEFQTIDISHLVENDYNFNKN